VQETGLANQYGTNEEFSLLIRHIPALAFLPIDEIPSAFEELKIKIKEYEQTDELVKWFEDNYILGRVRRVLRDGTVVRGNPLYPPQIWSVFDHQGKNYPISLTW
jgi:hypothetical protein